MISLPLTAEFIDAVAAEVEARLRPLLTEPPSTSPWLFGASQIAAHLGWPEQRVYKFRRQLPVGKHGNMLVARKEDLDRYMEDFLERRRA